MTEPNHIVYLTGFMGSGKSTVGPELARRLGYDFVDVDTKVEDIEGISITEIFRLRGERYFRNLEKRVLSELAGSGRRVVVALGGGALADEESRKLTKATGVLVYLKAKPEKILERVKRKKNRPMLLTRNGNPMNDADLSARLKALFEERERHYLEASIVVSTSEMTVSKSVEEIILKLKGRIA